MRQASYYDVKRKWLPHSEVHRLAKQTLKENPDLLNKILNDYLSALDDDTFYGLSLDEEGNFRE